MAGRLTSISVIASLGPLADGYHFGWADGGSTPPALHHVFAWAHSCAPLQTTTLHGDVAQLAAQWKNAVAGFCPGWGRVLMVIAHPQVAGSIPAVPSLIIMET